MKTLTDKPLYYKAAIKLLLAALVVTFLMLGREVLIPMTIAVFFAFLLPKVRLVPCLQHPKLRGL